METSKVKAAKQRGGEPIKEWLYAGPYERDVSELYYSNYSVPVEPFLPLMEEAERHAADCEPAEGKTFERFGQSKRWAYKRTEPSETKLTWARYGTYARFLATYAYSQIRVKEGGTYRFNLWAAGGAVVLMNGNAVFTHRRVGRVEGDYRFEAELQAETNHCLIILTNVHLHCTNAFTLSMEEETFECGVPFSLEPSIRDQVEADYAKFYLARHILQRNDRVMLNLQQPLLSSGSWVFTVFSSRSGENKRDAPEWERVMTIGEDVTEIALCACDELDESGEYTIGIDFVSSDGHWVPGIRFTFRQVNYIEPSMTGDYAQRKQLLMRHYAASSPVHYNEKELIYHELVKMMAHNGDRLDVTAIERTIAYINRRYDCADFAMHGLLRMYYRYRDSELLPEDMKAAMKDCILNFKYWEDEPGKSMMFTRSENHEILFFSAEYLAGLLFPADIFPNSNQNGLFHIQKGKAMAERWIKEKGTYGFMEWHSNTYYEEDMLALLNLYDFAEENSYIRILARSLIDLIGLIIATHSYKGVMGTTHGRCYEDAVIHPELEAMSHLNWLMFGQPERIRDHRLSIGAIALMDSGYTPDASLERIANAEEELYTLTRMGLFPHDGLGGVNCATYRTKDYMVSGLVESKKGAFGHQVQAGQALLSGNLPIFVTCFDNKSETTRPSYWGGQYRMPKTITHKNVLVYIYKIDEIAGCTHCYFPIEQFDEVVEAGKWLFGRKHEAYAAVYSLKTYLKTEEGKYKNRELLCLAKRNIWVIEAGNQEQFGSYEGFIRSIKEAALEEIGEDIVYRSPSIGEMRLGWDALCTIDGKPVLEPHFPLIRNTYAHGEYGSGITYMQLDGRQKILNFNL